MLFLFVFGTIAGMMAPTQTSINSRSGRFTESSSYASTISFFVGTLFLLILNIIFNIQMFLSSSYAGHSIDYHWWAGGLLDVRFLTGNLLLLPRLGAALTVVMIVAGQIIMGVMIDTLGLPGANRTSFTLLKGVGILVLLFGILLMNHLPKNKLKDKRNISLYIWLLIGLTFGFVPPLQITINSRLSKQMDSSLSAALVSFTIGTVALFTLTIIFNRSLKIKLSQRHLGRIRPLYLIDGILGVAFVTFNIILMPYLGAALTTTVAMFGQMIMGVIIDHLGIGVPKDEMAFRKFIGLITIAIGIVSLCLF